MKILLTVLVAYTGHAVALTSSAANTASKAPSSNLSPNQQALAALPPFPRTWVPLASVYELNGSRPNKLEFLGQNYVAYQNDPIDPTSWSVLDDACPHRLAPLSEGRIIVADKDANEIAVKDIIKKKKSNLPAKTLIECAYHGWAFDRDGTCARIPQATLELQARTIQSNRNCHVHGYSTRISKNILFAWLWPEDCLAYATEDWRQPEHMTAFMEEGAATYTRDAQYGYDTLLENIMDISHLPWAHHGLQGSRYDITKLNMTILGKVQEHGFQYAFDGTTKYSERAGKMHFRAPFVTSVHGELQSTKPGRTAQAPMPFGLDVFQIPTKPGWTRAIVCSAPARDTMLMGRRNKKDTKALSTAADKNVMGAATVKENKKKPKISLAVKVLRLLPRWIVHQFSHQFLDGDIIILHNQEQERFVRRKVDHEGYCIPAPSDRFVLPIRRWVSQYAHIPTLANGSIPASPIKRSALFDRWSQHSDQCKHCHAAFDGIQKWRRNNFVVMAASVVLARFLAARLLLVGCLAIWRILAIAEQSLTKGGFDHYKNA